MLSIKDVDQRVGTLVHTDAVMVDLPTVMVRPTIVA